MTIKPHIRFTVTILNIVIGWHLLFEGMVKLADPSWSSASYLKDATGPFAGLFKGMADSTFILGVADIVNMYGLALIGLLLITGLLVRYAAIGGAMLLFMYYISNPPFSATGIGYGVEGHYMIINKNLIEAITLILIAVLPKNWYYGLQNINFKKILPMKKLKPIMVDNNVEPSSEVYHRREVLKNLVWAPFLASFLMSWTKTKQTGINAITGATVPEDDYTLDAVAEGVHMPNEPAGKAQGIFPGRVTWVWNPASTNPNCTNTTTLSGIHDENDDAWYMDKNTNQEVVDKMLVEAILNISGKNDLKKAWDALFRYHNKKRGKGNASYKNGEKFFLKTNRTASGYGWHPGYIRIDKPETLCCETSPHFILAMLRQLINEAGVPQDMIYVGDSMSVVFDDEYKKYHAEFPDVHYLSRSASDYGRTKVKESSKDLMFYSDKGNIMTQAVTDKLYNVLEEAEYLISLAAMKGHHAAGISLCTKNHFGTQAREKALHLHAGLNSRRRLGYGHYRVLVDLMGNQHTGGKNLFYILDALWTGGDWNGLPVKFLMSPFNNHFTSSLFVSLDPVAIESVAFDFLRTEFTRPEHTYPHVDTHGVDDYLHQAADSKNWPEGIVYSPDGDGKPMAESLGVHEHWNNPEKKQYTRNLGTGKGIELVKIFQTEQG
jgi:uncharacterized membrane protein YphA (DoxX/SURF4 family)/uncharacterized protein (DUF362 family)